MKKVIFSFLFAIACCAALSSCIKNTPYVTTINPAMTADIGSYKFIASAVTPATIDTQRYDTSTTLVITGYGSDKVNPYDKIVLHIANYKGLTGVNSIVQGQAAAVYIHSGITSVATGGVVSVTSVSSTIVNGYFSFTTGDGINVLNGKFTVGVP